MLLTDSDAKEFGHNDAVLCANTDIAACNWLVEPGTSGHGLCLSCRLTRTRPNDDDPEGMAHFAIAERAKRRAIAALIQLNLPIVGRADDPEFGLAFDLLSSAHQPVTTGHQNGVITVDLAEADNAHREHLRAVLHEPYRTLLGHFRHEIGHAYFYRLVAATSPASLIEFGRLFGDPAADYSAALNRHYCAGPSTTWESSFVSSYAAVHAAEDWAETFAHYLHMIDTLDTAAACGLTPAARDQADPKQTGFDAVISHWLPLVFSLNMMHRSMGRDDLYPFMLPPPVLDKLRFIHTLVGDYAVPTAAARSGR